MKKKIALTIAACLFALVTLFSISISQTGSSNISVMAQANAAVNPDCPNGCLANGNGCWCKTWYDCYKEATWKKDNATLTN